MRNRLRQFISSVADNPDGLLGKVVALRFGLPLRYRRFPTSQFSKRKYRVLIAPVNYSAQAFSWARALERTDAQVSATNLSVDVPGGFSFPSDLEIPLPVFHNSRDWQRRELEAVVTEASHVLIEALEPPLGRLFSRSVHEQAEALRRRGIRVGFMQHGTEVRLPSRHADSDPWSYYREHDIDFFRAEQKARRNIQYLSGTTAPVFVSTPDLLLDLPFAKWCPVVVENSTWRVERSVERHNGPLRVTHAPTNPVLKGTPLIEPVLNKLHAAGIIDLQLVQGIPSSDMLSLYERTDVYLDQFRLGSYGVAACEAMAAGCAVIGNVSSQVRQYVTEATGQVLPIVQATPETLEDTLRILAEQPTLMREYGDEGVNYVRTVHDGRLSSSVLLDGFILD